MRATEQVEGRPGELFLCIVRKSPPRITELRPEGGDQFCHSNIWGKSRGNRRAKAVRGDVRCVLEMEGGFVWREWREPANSG